MALPQDQPTQPMMSPPGTIQPPEAGMAPSMGPQMPQEPQPAPPEMEDPNEQAMEEFENFIDAARMNKNLAEKFKNKRIDGGTLLLDKMGTEIVDGYEVDEESRASWMQENAAWLEMATLVKKTKSFPWRKASNVRYPLLATAAMQFSARAYPALVPSDGNVVKAKVIPKDPTGVLSDQAMRVAKHMSYQVMCKMTNWEEEMDKLLMTVAVSGIAFKKTYYSQVDGKNCSHLVYPEDFVINYHATSLENAYRKGDLLYFNQNQLQEKINSGEFLDQDLTSAPMISDETKVKQLLTQPVADKSTPHQFYACHTFWDLDGDGYEEPYIITVHLLSKKVVRIIARWDRKGVTRDDKQKILKITPIEYFTDFPFIPNPDGSIYALGFGRLIGPLNESADTLINQLIDAGTLNNLQAGFIAKGLRLKMGVAPFQPGEWRAVPASTDDLHKGIVPLPTKEPSGVLNSLLQMLITSANQLASIAEIFVGKMPGQNTPATTTQETVKQGMAVFTAIYKRIYRSLTKEFKKLHRLNRLNPDIVEEESKVVGVDLTESDYSDDTYIIPGGDPTGDSQTTRDAKIQQIGQMLSLGTIDPMAYTKWALASGEIPNFEQLLAQPQPPAPPPPDPKAQLIAAQTQAVQTKAQLDGQAKMQDIQIAKEKADLESSQLANKSQHEATMQALDLQGKKMDAAMALVQKVLDHHTKVVSNTQDAVATNIKTQQELQHNDEKHVQNLAHASQAHQQKQQQQKQEAKSKPKK